MTPTATYIASENCLQLLPRMPEPSEWQYYVAAVKANAFKVNLTKKEKQDIDDYKAHIASLRRLPCSPECKGLWADQQKVVEGKDYEVKECRTWIENHKIGWGCYECCNRDRCDEDCMATYCRPDCPFCKGKGWFKDQPLFAFPLVPVKSEDEFVWTDELVKEYAEQYRFSSSRISISQFKYSLTKR